MLAVQQANRGPQVVVARRPASTRPNDKHPLIPGTPAATTLVGGVAAQILPRNPKLTPDALRRQLLVNAHQISGRREERCTDVIDALAAARAAEPLEAAQRR